MAINGHVKCFTSDIKALIYLYFNSQMLNLVSCSCLHSRKNMTDDHKNKHRFDH